MAVFAELPDGTKLEFPDGVEQGVVDSVVKKHLGSAQVPSEEENPIIGFGKQAAGVAEAGASLLAPLPATIAGGVMGLGDLLSGKGLDRAGNRVREIQQSNFGLGEYVPYTEKGKQFSKKLSGVLESGLDMAGEAGQYVGGDLGEANARVAAEVLMNFVPLGAGAKATGMAMRKSGKPSTFTEKLTEAFKEPEVEPAIREAAEAKHRDIQTANRLEAAIEKQNVPYNDTIFVGREGNAIPGETGRAMAESTKGIEYEAVPPDGVIPRDSAKTGVEVPRGNQWIPDENNIPVRQGLPENKLLPPETYHEGPEVNALGNAIQEANGPRLGPDDVLGSENLHGPMGAPDLIGFPKELPITTPAGGIKVLRGQRGALDFGGEASKLKQKQDVIEKIVGEKLFTAPPTADSLIAESLAAGKDGRGINSMEAGATLTAAKRNSPLVQGVGRIVQSFKNKAEDNIRSNVFPTERAIRSLSSNELIQLGEVMKAEMFHRKKLSTKALADLGLSEKQLLAYESTRDMFAKALERENAGRAAKGQKPITAEEAYLSSRWKGDYRRAIHDKDGKLVWFLAADSRRGLKQQTEALMKKFPELVEGSHSDHTTGSMRGSNLNAREMYSEMVDVLGRDDPAVAKIKEWVEAQGLLEASGMLAQERHFKSKGNVRGFVGDRPSNTFFGKLDPRKEAIAMFQQQITYSKNAHKWAAMQEAGVELKKVFSSKELADQQPNNMNYVRDYYRNQLGLSTTQAIAGLENALRHTGMSPNALNSGINNVKGLWITQKLAVSAGFLASNLIQLANMAPQLTNIMVKHGGNPLYALPVGLASGTLMALGHTMISKGDRSLYKNLGHLPAEQGQFIAKAMKYAEDNSVIARSIYDEAPIEASFGKTAQVGRALGKTITMPETIVRSVAYMTYANMLKSSGKFKNDMEIFRSAEEMVNMSMVDYRAGERAMLFDKLGTLGNAMNTLQTFPINYYQQWNWAAREARRKNPLPAAAMFATQAYIAGAMGVPGFSDTDKMWNFMKGLLAEHDPQTWDKVKNIDLKEMALSAGPSVLYGGLSEQSGVAFTSRASAPAGSEMMLAPGGPYVDFARQARDVTNALINPSAQSATQAALSVALSGLQGGLETGPLKDQTSVVNQETKERIYGNPRDLADRKGQVSRTPEEENLRKWGLRSQREVVEKDAAFRASKLESDSKTVISGLPGRIYNELRNNNTEKAQNLMNLYFKLTGKEITDEQIENQALEEFTTSAQRTKMNATSIPGMLAIKRLQQIQEANRR